MRRGGSGIGAIILALVGGWLLGINPLEILGLIGGIDGGQVVQAPAPSASGQRGVSPTDPGGRFVSTVLASAEDAWTEVFRQGGAEYRSGRRDLGGAGQLHMKTVAAPELIPPKLLFVMSELNIFL
jgi:predicted metalloprotease